VRLQVEKIVDLNELDSAFRIRSEVFVLEQKVNASDERDEHEASAFHFLAKSEGVPVGVARWRFTETGVKLERFAVLKEVRGKGIGQALVQAVLDDISKHPDSDHKIKYLHAQLEAASLYEKFGFQKVGDIFEECNILHYKMELA
jgi:predicted GNAT family N-acyltransferase